jgi:putative glutamine amidotransferase
MSRPVIGICTALERAKWSVWDQQAYLLPRSYIAAVQRAGGIALMLPPDEALEREPDEVLDLVDGLILAGGADIDPASYGDQPHPETRHTVPERDGFELALARRALERDIPLLGVCRGMQLLNVVLGGDLIAHIPDRFGTQVIHRSPDVKPVPHPVAICPESRLARVYGASAIVQSVHHQAVGRLADGLRAVAWAADGVVEAIESERHDFVVAVQWHPELDAFADDGDRRSVFDELVARAARYAARG